MFEASDTLHDCVRIASGVLCTLRIDPDRMRSGLSADMLATDLAEYLVRKGKAAFKPAADCFGRMWHTKRVAYNCLRMPLQDLHLPSAQPALHAHCIRCAATPHRRALPGDAPHQRCGGEAG